LGLSKNTVLIKIRLDRPNIFLCAIPIHSTLDDHADLNMLVPEINEDSETTIIPGDIPKTMVFVDNVSAVMRVVHQLRWLLLARLRDADVVRLYHGEASASGNAKTKQLFREGITRLLVCTSAAGMGVDVNDVERVAQWRFPFLATFDDLWQRFGRCARDPKLSGLAMLFYEPSKIVDWGVGDGHVLEGFRAYNKPAGTDTQAFCDHLYTGEKPDVINEAQRKVSKQDPSLLWWVSSRGCRRRTALYLLDGDERSEPFSTGTQFCDNCDVCVSRLVDCGGPGKLLGVDISLTQPFRVPQKRSRQTGNIAKSTLKQREYIDKKLQHWCLQRWKTLAMGDGEQRFFAILADEWPVSELQRSKIVEFINEIKDRQSLFEALGKTCHLGSSVIEQFVEEIVDIAISESAKRPPTPPEVTSTNGTTNTTGTPSLRWLPEHQFTPIMTPGTGRARSGATISGQRTTGVLDCYGKLEEVRARIREIEERSRSVRSRGSIGRGRGRFSHLSPQSKNRAEKEYRSLKAREYYWVNKCRPPQSGLAGLRTRG
jgi:hypothetical protein